MQKSSKESLFDENAPQTLVERQLWFGKILDNPDFRPVGNHLSSPLHRLEIYHEQMWLRLCKTLHDHFPTLTRLFGKTLFDDEIAKPYLVEHPPSHYLLHTLGNALLTWLELTYHHADRPLILALASIDHATHTAFWAPHHQPRSITPTQKLTLQPHIHLFHLPSDLFTFREKLLTHPPEHWQSHPFPPLTPQDCHFILYKHHTVKWLQITEPEYFLLSRFSHGASITEVCEHLETHPIYCHAAATSLPIWFHQWTSLEWFR